MEHEILKFEVDDEIIKTDNYLRQESPLQHFKVNE